MFRLCYSYNVALAIGVIGLTIFSGADAATLRVPGDHRTIQAAIDAGASGDIVLVSAGVYRERIRLRKGIVLRSAGDDSPGKIGLARAENTVLDGGGSVGKPGVVMAEGSVVDGFTVTGVGRYNEVEWSRHHETRGEEQSHDRIGNARTPGISITGVTCHVENNIVHHNGDTGIEIRGVEGKRCSPRVFRNVSYRNMGGGIGSTHGSSAVIEENTCFQNFYAGIGQEGASPFVSDNECYENIRAGIGVGRNAEPIVQGNKCYRNRRAGIGVRSGPKRRPIVKSNECYENGMAGIGVRGGSTPLIVDNRCERNRLAGIGTRGRSRPVIVGNVCTDNEKAGIGQREDARTVLVDNECRGNKAAGIGFETCDSGRSTMVGNRVIDNALVAVGVQRGWRVEISENELSREAGLPPIVMVFDGAEANLRDNVIRGSGVAGVRVGGTVRAVGNRFEGTALRKGGPPNFAVWALPGSEVALQKNTMSGWRHAISAEAASLIAIDNRMTNYWQTAVRVTNASSPSIVVRNVFESVHGHPGVEIRAADGTEQASIVRDNIENRSTSAEGGPGSER